MRPERESRLAEDNHQTAEISTATKINFESTPEVGQIRCRCCRRVLTAERSVRLELGPVCRRQGASLAEVA